MSFDDIYLEVEGKQVKSPQWKAVKGARKCNAATSITDPATIKITWDTAVEAVPLNQTSVTEGAKWWATDVEEQH